MSDPRIELIPSRPAVRSDAPTTLDVLLRITPPEPAGPQPAARPALNLGLVLDRSGSMGERNKITFAREAAAFAVRELAATDRVSVTTFDDRIETIAPNAPAADKARLVALIEGVQPRGSTALHGGWAEGGAQVRANLVEGGLNRVLLLSDGLANVGESRPDAIATDVHRLATEGVSTTTLGVGQDYNEDLLEAMARAGDGNYYYVESPAQLPALFAAELQGLTATVGTEVGLAVEPGPAAAAAEVLNELDRTPGGGYKLPNLVAGMPVLVVARVTVPAAAGAEAAVCRFRVEWSTPDGARRSAAVGLTVPAVPGAAWTDLPANTDVQERAVLLAVARAKKLATRASEQGDQVVALRCLEEARRVLADAPATPEVEREVRALAELEAMIREGELVRFRKTAKYDAYQRHHSKPLRRPDDAV